jgi:hypothetical protein
VLLLLEAFLALFILLGIVWWTMFSGRKNGEIKTDIGIDTESKTQDERHPPNS